ncbi:short-chain dehydrogenase/reductase SDR [Thermosinus carboxydivorans Nor1]|uniref:Short-chain dehydrogenase/reductase SDR n=1 Tax=Thermosinus carboxydivorans Nor1 TaxID=401526 RepID=A1HSG6_9FIRM|nr:glucose 1-dehydrogenase [Thermosinus carboxydivorans]EAX47030.1 short-chain dehydrogenase/reductase SDR [Thermosinus carboxydivorans Nor1]
MNFPSADLSGKTALVTGGSKGIGFGMACALAHAGADIVIVSRNLAEGEKAAQEIRNMGRKAMAISCDVTIPAAVNAMVEKALATFGKIDILLNNAGMNIRKPVVEVTEEDWDKVLDTNLKGIFLVAQRVGKEMIKQQSGKVINVASILGVIGLPWLASYAASKGGIVQLTKVLALEWAQYNINVNCIAPAYIRTPMTEGWLSDQVRLQSILSNTPLGRLGTVEDLAGPVVFLASDWSNYITGHTLLVDGGWTAR